VIGSQNEILTVAPRRAPETQQLGEVRNAWPDPIRMINVGGFNFTVYPGMMVIVTAKGDLSASVRSGASLPLGETQAVIRLDPPEPPSNARGTELVGK
jgi:hypothetical protein